MKILNFVFKNKKEKRLNVSRKKFFNPEICTWEKAEK